jgi:hypothetical protein
MPSVFSDCLLTDNSAVILSIHTGHVEILIHCAYVHRTVEVTVEELNCFWNILWKYSIIHTMKNECDIFLNFYLA